MPQHDMLRNLAFMVSISTNIFFIAFFLGKVSVGSPPPPPFMDGAAMIPSYSSALQPHTARGGHPHPRFEDKDRHGFPTSPDGMGERVERSMPPPPPMFSPEDLFSPDERGESFSKMEKSFQEAEQLRLDFVQHLEKEKLSKEAILDHFAAVDKLMNSVRSEMQLKAAEKISSLSDEERAAFIRKLKEQRPPFNNPRP